MESPWVDIVQDARRAWSFETIVGRSIRNLRLGLLLLEDSDVGFDDIVSVLIRIVPGRLCYVFYWKPHRGPDSLLSEISGDLSSSWASVESICE